jgi:hypothetical protein
MMTHHIQPGLKKVILTKMLEIGLDSNYKLNVIQLIQEYSFLSMMQLHSRVKGILKIYIYSYDTYSDCAASFWLQNQKVKIRNVQTTQQHKIQV